MTTPARPHRLSKSRFVAGCQCHKLLWWRVHEPNSVSSRNFFRTRLLSVVGEYSFPRSSYRVDVPMSRLNRPRVFGSMPRVFLADSPT